MLKKISINKWIKALKSGYYKQGEGYLLKNNRYCCLGVAYQIAGAEKEDIIGKGLPSDVGDSKHNDGSKIFLGMNLRYSISQLSEFNDGGSDYKKHTFKEIAKLLLGKIKPIKKI